jgi:hypothetical protein
VERTFVMVKPDGVQRGLTGTIIARLEQRGLKLAAARFLWVSQELAETHYAVHKGRPFYEGLIRYITSRRLWQWCGKDPMRLQPCGKRWAPPAPPRQRPAPSGMISGWRSNATSPMLLMDRKLHSQKSRCGLNQKNWLIGIEPKIRGSSS